MAQVDDAPRVLGLRTKGGNQNFRLGEGSTVFMGSPICMSFDYRGRASILVHSHIVSSIQTLVWIGGY